VTTRTIRRDLQALEEAGFPIFDDRTRDDGRTRWSLNGQAFKGLAAGLTLAELSALYFSRTLVASLTGTPFRDEVERAFEKLSAGLTPHMRQFLDQLPRAIATKPDPMRRRTSGDDRQPQVLARALEATLHQRQATFVYHSRSSDRTKTYHVHPYRLAYAQGGLYLLAYVPEYGEVRTFAVERIEEMSLLEAHFTPIEELPDEAFPDSLGVHSGPTAHVDISFRPAVADYVRTRDWHPSQRIAEQADGGLTLSLDVCIDRALTTWILGFGASARVIAPESLARAIAAQLSEAAAAYTSHD
jgi:predicted DNA-binding transcriptional regulator YafY